MAAADGARPAPEDLGDDAIGGRRPDWIEGWIAPDVLERQPAPAAGLHEDRSGWPDHVEEELHDLSGVRLEAGHVDIRTVHIDVMARSEADANECFAELLESHGRRLFPHLCEAIAPHAQDPALHPVRQAIEGRSKPRLQVSCQLSQDDSPRPPCGGRFWAAENCIRPFHFIRILNDWGPGWHPGPGPV